MIRQVLFNTALSTLRRRLTQETTRSYVRRAREPGINRRLELFSEEFVENDPETIESLESDFMNVGEAHKQFEREQKHRKETVASRIVGRKYFNEKEKFFNFLTWSEKEQIRSLHKQNQNEWSPEKLSESFPADPLTISKIIRNYWQPKDEKRVQKHDESVRNNWAKFKAGEIEVDPILKSHLQKFAHRNLNEVAKPKVNRQFGVKIPKPQSSEFSSIVTSCKKYAEKDEEKTDFLRLESNEYEFPDRPRDSESDSVVLKGKAKNSMKWMPLSEYQKLSPDIVLNQEEVKVQVQEPALDLSKIQKHKDASVVSLEFNNTKVFESLEVQEEIKIPKSLWKKGQTYKVSDCFYDDDGEFLYRVPGLK